VLHVLLNVDGQLRFLAHRSDAPCRVLRSQGAAGDANEPTAQQQQQQQQKRRSSCSTTTRDDDDDDDDNEDHDHHDHDHRRYTSRQQKRGVTAHTCIIRSGPSKSSLTGSASSPFSVKMRHDITAA
jgi:hypothetical protein